MHRHVVGDEQDRGAELALDLADHRQHVLLHDHVERGRRLVGDDELGPAHRGQRNRHPLAHAARELVRIGVEHVGPELHTRQMAPHRVEEPGHRLLDVTKGEVDERMTHPAHRVQHAHRTLHDVAEMAPADRGERVASGALHLDGAGREIEGDGAGQYLERRLGGGGDGLDQRGLAAARFARQPVDLARFDREAHLVDSTHVAGHAESRGAVVGSQAVDDKDAHRSVRPSRLRGSMYSFIDTASRNSPMKVMTTSSTGKKIHHQMPATSAVCWLAQ